MNEKLDWSLSNWYYRDLLIQNGNEPAKVIYHLLYRQAIANKDFEFAKKLNIDKVISQLKIQKYKKKTIIVDNYKSRRAWQKNYTWYNKYELSVLLERESIKKSKQNTFLSRHSREESTISSTRESIIECLVKKVETKKINCTTKNEHLFTKSNRNTENLTLQHILTDIHVNEVTYRKWKKFNWDTDIALKTVIRIVDELIKKQVDSDFKYSKLELLLLWDLIGTKIHEWLDLDIEPIRASKLLASTLSKIYKNLKEYFDDIVIVIVPWNHSETRIWSEKNDRFNENYDFLVSQNLKEFLSVIWCEDKVLAPSRDVPVISKVLNWQVHWFWHWDRFSTDFKKMLPMFSEYYNVKYLDFFHEWHFHNQKIRYEDWFLKMTYPCVTETSFYGQNRYGALKREDQVWNIYNENWEILETYYLDEKKIKDNSFLTNISVNLDLDLSEIFIDTIKYLSR